MAGIGAHTQARRRNACELGTPAGTARNLIFMVSDGMSTGTLSLADLYLRQHAGRASHWVNLWSNPAARRASAQTYSADGWVTDSAAGGSAWGIGVHINNGAINITPEGRQCVPLLVQARQSGKATGVVTTARVTHATPASFYANAPKREMEKQIAVQVLERGLDVMLGGGGAYFPPELLAKHAGITVVRDKAGLTACLTRQDVPPSPRLLGLFDPQHVPYVLDRGPTVPSLMDMTRAALARFSDAADAQGFAVQIEGGRVDHAAHDNDAGSLIAEQVEFDDAIGLVLEWMQGRDDTLLIITTDHANANPGLTYYGKRGKDSFALLPNVKHSFTWIAEQWGKDKKALTAERITSVVREATGITLDEAETSLLIGALSKHRVSPFAAANTWTSVLGEVLADHLGIAFLSPNHTSDLVEVTALGPGAETLPPLIENVALHGLATRALGLKEAELLPGMEQVVAPGVQANDD